MIYSEIWKSHFAVVHVCPAKTESVTVHLPASVTDGVVVLSLSAIQIFLSVLYSHLKIWNILWILHDLTTFCHVFNVRFIQGFLSLPLSSNWSTSSLSAVVACRGKWAIPNSISFLWPCTPNCTNKAKEFPVKCRNSFLDKEEPFLFFLFLMVRY